jgi:hypothetical protein
MTSKVDSKEVDPVAGLKLFHFSRGARNLHCGRRGGNLGVYRMLLLRMPEQ